MPLLSFVGRPSDLQTNFFVSLCYKFAESKKRRPQICCAAIITSINVLAFQNHRRRGGQKNKWAMAQ